MAESVTRFGAVDENFSKTIQQMEGRLEGFTGSVQNVNESTSALPAVFTKAAVAVAAFVASVAGAALGVKTFQTALDFVGRLDDLSKQTGATKDALVLLQTAFDNTGSSASKVGPALTRVQDIIAKAGDESPKAVAALENLGLTFGDLKNLTPEAQFEKIMTALGNIPSRSEQAQAAVAIFGQTLGREMIPLAREFQEEMKKAGEELGSLPEVLDQFGPSLTRFEENIDALKKKPEQFSVGVVGPMSTLLANLSGQFRNFDAAGLGVAIGTVANDLLVKMLIWAEDMWHLVSGIWEGLSVDVTPYLTKVGTLISLFVERAKELTKTIFGDFENIDFSQLGENIGRAIRGAFADPGKFFDLWWAYMDLKAREFANLLPSLLESGLQNNKIALDALIESGSIDRISDLLYNGIVAAGTKGFEKWTELMMIPVDFFEGLWDAVVTRSGEKLRASLTGALDGSLTDFLNSINPVQGLFNTIAQQFGNDLSENVSGSAQTFGAAYSAEGGSFTDKFWAGWRAMGSEASQEFGAGLKPTADALIDAATTTAEKATFTKVEMFDTEQAAATVAKHWTDLTQDAETLPEFSGQVLDDISQAELRVNGQSGISPALDANANALNQTADKTQAASADITTAYGNVAKTGQQFDTSTKQAGSNFAQATTAAGKDFARYVGEAMKYMTDSMRGLATENTLKRAVASLERLERKLPQPVLT